MAKPIIVEDKDLDLILRVTKATCGSHALRNVALMLTLFGTGLKPSEIAALRVDDYLDKHGKPKIDTIVRAEIAFNGRERPLMWVNKRLCKAIDDYLCDYKMHEPLFFSRPFEPFTPAGLTNLLNKLLSPIEGVTTNSARQTLAVKLNRKGVDLVIINRILGQSNLTATKKMIQGDTVRLSELVKDII
jgi:integrase/recombinase XerD